MAVDNTHGQWQYSVDDGASWVSIASEGVSVGPVDDSNTLVLDEAAIVRFVPAIGFSGSAGDLNFRAWDQSDGASSGSVIDASSPSDTDSVSQVVETATMVVEMPVGVSTMVPSTQEVNFGVPVEFSVSGGNPVVVSDGAAGSDGMLVVTLSVTDGVLNLNPAELGSVTFLESTSDGADRIVIEGTESSLNAALDGLTFTQDIGFEGNLTLNVDTQITGVVLGDFESITADAPADLVVVDAERGEVLELTGGEFVEILDGDGNATNFGEPQNVTIAGWVNVDAGAENGVLLSIGESVDVVIDKDGKGVEGYYNSTHGLKDTNSKITIAGTGWRHVAYSIDSDSDTQTLYIDGVAVNTKHHNRAIDYLTGSTTIGVNPSSPGVDFEGRIDDVFVFDRALTAAEIAALQSEHVTDADSIEILVHNENPADLGIRSAQSNVTFALSELLTAGSNLNNSTLSLGSFSQPDNGTLSIDGDGNLLFIPDPVFVGGDSFEFEIRDSGGNIESGSAQFTINDVPDANDDDFTIDFGTPLSDSVAINDSDAFGNALQFSLSSDANNGSLVLNADGSFSYTPDLGFTGTDSFSYTVHDGTDVSNVATATVIVEGTPEANHDSFAVVAGETTVLDILANDMDPNGSIDLSHVVVVGAPSNGALAVSSDGELTYQHRVNRTATTDSFTYQIVDDEGLTTQVATVSLVIEHRPDDIQWTGTDVSEGAVAGTIVGDVDANDDDGDALTFALQDNDNDSSNDRFEIDAVTGTITVKNPGLIDFEANETHQVTVIVTDATGLTQTQELSISVIDVDEAPTVDTVLASVDEGGSTVGFLATAVNDPEGGDISFAVVDGPAHGDLRLLDNGRWRYLHDDSEQFTDQFTFSATDEGGNVVESTVQLNIVPVDDAPVSNADSIVASPSDEINIGRGQLLGNDVNIKGTTTIEITTAPTAGTLIQNANGSLSYIPNDQNSTGDFFEYRVTSDGQVGNVARVTITTPAVNHTATSGNDAPAAEVTSTNEPIIEDVETKTDETPLEPEETIETTTEQVLQGPIATPTGDGATGGDSEFGNEDAETETGLFADGPKASAAEIGEATQRRLLWQPRYGEYGSQIYREVSVAGGGGGLPGEESFTLLNSGLSLGISGEFFEHLDATNELIGRQFEFSEIPSLVFPASSLLTVGYLVWVARAGALVSTFISVPTWTQFDPLPVIESGIPGTFGEDDEALETLVDTI